MLLHRPLSVSCPRPLQEVAKWEAMLRAVSEAIEAILQVQRSWMYLENIFVGSEDIRKQLPSETSLFDRVNGTFVRAMQDLRGTSNVVAATTRRGLLAGFQVCRGGSLDACFLCWCPRSLLTLGHCLGSGNGMRCQPRVCFAPICPGQRIALLENPTPTNQPYPASHQNLAPAVHGRRPGAHPKVSGWLP
jgi:hypothetical protein